jgi:hypothetical protein
VARAPLLVARLRFTDDEAPRRLAGADGPSSGRAGLHGERRFDGATAWGDTKGGGGGGDSEDDADDALSLFSARSRRTDSMRSLLPDEPAADGEPRGVSRKDSLGSSVKAVARLPPPRARAPPPKTHIFVADPFRRRPHLRVWLRFRTVAALQSAFKGLANGRLVAGNEEAKLAATYDASDHFSEGRVLRKAEASARDEYLAQLAMMKQRPRVPVEDVSRSVFYSRRRTPTLPAR